MRDPLSAEALDQLFRSARTYHGWTDAPVEERVVRDLYDLLKWGSTSANSCPARFVWVRSPEGKAKLAEFAWDRNRPKILAAPLTVIIGNDLDFADRLPELMPHNAEAMQKAFAPPAVAEATATRNGTLQGAYLLVAARALGLDCGPMSGLRQCRRRPCVLRRHTHPVELHLQRRSRQPGLAVPAQPTAFLRGRRAFRLEGSNDELYRKGVGLFPGHLQWECRAGHQVHGSGAVCRTQPAGAQRRRGREAVCRPDRG